MDTIEKIKDTARDFKSRLQRFHRGWANEDVWSMDRSLAQIITPMLKDLRKNNCGYPHGLTEKKWEDILDKMIIGFQSILNENKIWIKKLTTDERQKLLEIEYKKQQKELRLFAKHYRGLCI
jgi:hypothetical protein